MEIAELMSRNVVTLKSAHTVEQARLLLREHSVSALPVVGEQGEPRGIVSAIDLAAELDPKTPVSEVMTPDVYAFRASDEAEKVVLVMRNQHIHHVVVTEGKKLVGILSALDLLELIEVPS